MHHPHEATFDLQTVWRNIVHRPARWLVPAGVIAALALGYAIFRSPTWEASQGLVIRDEAIGRVFTAQGKFASVDDMQTAQETVLELAKSTAVVEAALMQVGPPNGDGSANWPALEDIESLQSRINVKAPNGAEFGRTEVFYLVVEDKNRERSLRLTAAICNALETRLGELRDEKARSLINELQQTVDLTKASLHDATGRLAALEAQVGSDLAELRILNESASGESTLRRSITNIRDELRAERKAQLANEQLLELLIESQDDPQSLVAMPSQLLQSQPALQRLKDGLVDAQLRTSRALGLMSPEHPQVQAAVEEEKDVRRRLHAELAVAIDGVRVELKMNERRIAALSQQLAEAQQRMNTIAGLRAEYNNLTAEVHERTEAWNQAHRDLADARARQAAAHSASLLTRLDGPHAGADPVGPARSTIVAAGGIGGLLFGLGVVVLTATPIVLPETRPATAHQPQAAAPQPATPKPATPQPATPQPATPQRGLTLPVGNLSLKEALARIAFGGPTAAQA